jgi:hypothetical protein
VWWTDRSPEERRVAGQRAPNQPFTFTIPVQPLETVVYYFVEVSQGATSQTAPPEGRLGPAVLFISADHLGDMDRHDDLLDAFDVIRLLRHHAWREPAIARLDLDGDDAIDDIDLRLAVAVLLGGDRDWIRRIETDDVVASFTLFDGSRFEVPRQWSGRITDIRASRPEAARLVYERRTFASLQPGPPADPSRQCLQAEVTVNRSFYRREPHEMRRYNALAIDNILRQPLAYATASLYRIFRIFIIVADDDDRTVYGFQGSSLIYQTAMGVSLLYLVLFLAGLGVAVGTNRLQWQLVLPIVYIPATLCFVLTNMRYTVTAQPFVFTFIAMALVKVAGMRERRRAQTAPTET